MYIFGVARGSSAEAQWVVGMAVKRAWTLGSVWMATQGTFVKGRSKGLYWLWECMLGKMDEAGQKIIHQIALSQKVNKQPYVVWSKEV